MNSDSRDKKRLLVVVDMQEDFVRGSLATKEAQAIIGAVQKKIKGHNGQIGRASCRERV